MHAVLEPLPPAAIHPLFGRAGRLTGRGLSPDLSIRPYRCFDALSRNRSPRPIVVARPICRRLVRIIAPASAISLRPRYQNATLSCPLSAGASARSRKKAVYLSVAADRPFNVAAVIKSCYLRRHADKYSLHCRGAQQTLCHQHPSDMVCLILSRDYNCDSTTIRRCHEAFDYDGSDRNYDSTAIRLRQDYDEKIDMLMFCSRRTRRCQSHGSRRGTTYAADHDS